MAQAVDKDAAEPLLLSIKLAAKRLGLTEYMVRQHFPITRIGNRAYVEARALREYVEAASA